MFSNGLLEETDSLMKLYGNSDLEVLRSLGYLQAVRHLKGEWTLDNRNFRLPGEDTQLREEADDLVSIGRQY